MRERRLDPATREWVVFANVPPDRAADRDEPCPLCPTTDDRATDIPLSGYEIAVVEDRFPVLEAAPPPPSTRASELYPVAPAVGASELVAYSDDHDASLATVGLQRIERVVEVWAERYAQLGARGDVGYVFVHETRGAAAGAVLAHPHSRIDAYPEIPPRPLRELRTAAAHLEAHGTCVLCDVVARESADEARTVAANPSFLAVVPFAARFPFEVHVLAQRHAPSLLDLTDVERAALAEVLEQVLAGYDRLFGFPLPYVLAIHQAPTDDGQWQPVSHFHVELAPPHRSERELRRPYAPELGAGVYVNDAVPERSAARLRAAVAG